MTRQVPEHILYPVGHHAVGKTELCNYLVEKHKFEVVETGAMVRALYAERDAQFADYNLGQFVRAVESAYPGYFDRKLAARIDELDTTSGAVIVNGMRSYTNIARAQDIYPNTRHSIVWMDAPVDQLYERYKLREGKQLSREEFNGLLDFDMGLGLALTKENADFYIQNDSSLESLHEQADHMIRGLGLTAINATQAQLDQQ